MKSERLMIASDIHGDARTTELLIERFEKSGARKLILLGDILYHGPRNDLPEGYSPKRVIGLLNPLAEKILCVRGNCDTEVDQMVLEFPILADYACLMTDGLRIFITHGHRFNTQTPPPLAKGDILLHGHTHVPAWQSFGQDNLYVNPGSLSIPKENSQKGYILYEARRFDFCSIDGEVYRSESV